MQPDELRDILAALGLTQARAARLLGVERRTVLFWLSGDRAVPPLTAKILRLARDGKFALDLLDW